jgi:RimJ/RimL family protein N-acetyltransferase
MDVYLETERMVLRRFTDEDIELIVALDSDPGVKRYIDNEAPIDRAELIDILGWWQGYYTRTVGYGFWAAIDKSTGEFLGWFHFRPGKGAGPLEPELGYRLRRAAWGRGYGTEGSLALIDHGFSVLGVERVYATTMAVNIGSRRVMEKAGLRLVRTFRLDWPVYVPGEEEGDVEYALTREEWLEAQSGKPAVRPRNSDQGPN